MKLSHKSQKEKNQNLEKNLRSLKMETFVSKNEDFMGYPEIEPQMKFQRVPFLRQISVKYLDVDLIIDFSLFYERL